MASVDLAAGFLAARSPRGRGDVEGLGPIARRWPLALAVAGAGLAVVELPAHLLWRPFFSGVARDPSTMAEARQIQGVSALPYGNGFAARRARSRRALAR
jgi:hypothetical protein